MRYAACTAILTGLLLAAPAMAGPLEERAGLAFAEGRFQEAADAARSLPGERSAPSPDALAFAARALLAKAVCEGRQPEPDLLDDAERLARSALERAPDHAEARLQLAIALSLRLRPMTPMAAYESGLGREVRQLAEGVLADRPDDPYAHGLLAVWHVEVVRRGGGLGARLMGADMDAAFAHYRAAIAVRPDDPGLHWQFARALTALDPERYRSWIDYALARAGESPAGDAVARTMKARAGHLAATLDRESADALRAWASARL